MTYLKRTTSVRAEGGREAPARGGGSGAVQIKDLNNEVPHV